MLSHAELQNIEDFFFLDTLFFFFKWKLERGLENISQYAELRLGLGVAFSLSLYLVFSFLLKKFLLRFRKNLLA